MKIVEIERLNACSLLLRLWRHFPQRNERTDDSLENIEKCENCVCRHESASRFLSARRTLLNNKMLVSAEPGGVTAGERKWSENDQLVKVVYDMKFLPDTD